jgi:hypothetical protein
MNMLASDLQNPEFTGASNPDSLLHVVFYSKPVYQEFASKQAGSPIFKDMDFVRIHTPGNQLNIIDRMAVDEDKKRFPLHWAHYKEVKGDAETVVGTPVSEWSMLSRSQAEILRGMKFFSVEQIAGASDEAINKIGMNVGFSAVDLRNKARNFLKVAQDSATAEKQEDELKKRDAEIAEMKEQIEKLLANSGDKQRLKKEVVTNKD